MSKKSKSGAKPNPGRFRKGGSGNPGGRPKAGRARRSSAMDVLLDGTITISERGIERELSTEEALHFRTYQDAINGNTMSVRMVLEWILKYETWHNKHESEIYYPITRRISPDPDNANAALVLLGIATVDVLDPTYRVNYRRLLLEPWATQMALDRRRGGQCLTDDDRHHIDRCTHSRASLRWPRSMRK